MTRCLTASCARILTLLIAASILCVVSPLARARPGCKEALFDPGQLSQKLSTARGYAISIGLLLAVPFVLVAGTAALIVRAQRRRRRQEC